MLQVIAVLITAGLIAGGLVGTDVIGGGDAQPVSSQAAAAPAAGETPDEPAPSEQESAAGSGGAGGGQGGGAASGGQGDGAPGGGQDKPNAAAPAGGSQRDVARFCTTTQRLQRASRQFFAQVESQGAAPGPPEPAQDRFLEQSQKLIGTAQQLAPASVRSDLDLIVNALRAGPDQAPDPAQVKAAQRSIAQFERKSC